MAAVHSRTSSSYEPIKLEPKERIESFPVIHSSETNAFQLFQPYSLVVIVIVTSFNHDPRGWRSRFRVAVQGNCRIRGVEHVMLVGRWIYQVERKTGKDPRGRPVLFCVTGAVREAEQTRLTDHDL